MLSAARSVREVLGPGLCKSVGQTPTIVLDDIRANPFGVFYF
jgi:hypothetical protein